MKSDCWNDPERFLFSHKKFYFRPLGDIPVSLSALSAVWRLHLAVLTSQPIWRFPASGSLICGCLFLSFLSSFFLKLINRELINISTILCESLKWKFNCFSSQMGGKFCWAIPPFPIPFWRGLFLTPTLNLNSSSKCFKQCAHLEIDSTLISW